jgi:signal peptidase I
MDETPDYTTYSLDQLEHALRHTNQELHPERFGQIVGEIDRRRREPALIDATEKEHSKKRIPILAFFLSVKTPGLGQLYNGQLKRAIVLACVFGAITFPFLFVFDLLHSFSGLLLFLIDLIVLLALYLFTAVDAYRGAVRAREVRLRRYNRWYVYVGVMAIVHFVPWPPDLPKQQLIGTFHSYRIVGGFMSPTLAQEDHVLVDSSYVLEQPRRGDIVVFPRPDKPAQTLIQRVMAVEGETIELKNKAIYVNGRLIADSWGHSFDGKVMPGSESNRDNMGPLRIPDGAIFALGDNRDSALDSRFFGAVRKETIQRKPLYIYWATNKRRIGMTLK